MADHLYTFINPVRLKDIELICKVLNSDGVLALPMDVSWAYACSASSVKALSRIQRLKPNHPKDRPFSIVCDSIAMASRYVTIDNSVYPWLKKAMPGPFTVILERHSKLAKLINDNRRQVGLRIPDSTLILAISHAFDGPIATSTIVSNSSLIFDPQEAPTFGWQVQEAFGHALDLIVDLGEESPKTETSIVDMTSDKPTLIRHGAGDISLFGL